MGKKKLLYELKEIKSLFLNLSEKIEAVELGKEVEVAWTLDKLEKRSGTSVFTLRTWMRRSDNPLPFVNGNKKGAKIMIFPSVFNKWIKGESDYIDLHNSLLKEDVRQMKSSGQR